MKEKKYIDRLYQEKFKDFESAPREAVWENISSRLQENKGRRKRRIFPLWYRIAGVAALLLLIFLIGDWFNSNSVTSPAVVNEDIREPNPGPSFENPDGIVASEEAIGEIPLTNLPKGISPGEAEKEPSGKSGKGNNKNIRKASSISASGVKISSVFLADQVENLLTFGRDRGSSEENISQIRSLTEEAEKLEKEMSPENELARNSLELSTFAAPVFYGNLGEGNFLDPQFNNNSSQGEITYSYGVQLAYALTRNFKIRSGVNIVSVSYNTNGIEYHAILRPQAVANVIYDKDQFREFPANKSSRGSEVAVNGMYRESAASINGAFLNQKLGYLEIPVELEYNLIDKKIEINIIGGASTLFLNENIVSVYTKELTTELGKAGNLNDISFTTNLGLGMDYNLTKNFEINLEPVFKYQFNAFNSSTGQFQPFYLAIYSGLSFEF